MKKILIEIKEHKVDFVMGLLSNMPFVTITEMSDSEEKEESKKATPEE